MSLLLSICKPMLILLRLAATIDHNGFVRLTIPRPAQPPAHPIQIYFVNITNTRVRVSTMGVGVGRGSYRV